MMQPGDSIRVEQHLGLVHALLKRGPWERIAAATGIALDDLAQEGAIGMLRARESWDPAQGSWSTYAAIWIHHHVRRYIANNGAAVRIPVYLQDRRRRAGESERPQVYSLDRPLGDDDGTWHDLLAAPEPEHDRDDLPSDSLEALIADTPCLSEREAQVLRQRGAGRTLKEIGDELGVSRERVRQIEEQAIDLVRRAAGVRVTTPAPMETKAPTAPEADAVKREVAQLRGQGLGLHAVAQRLGITHHAVKAVERELLARIAAALEPAA